MSGSEEEGERPTPPQRVLRERGLRPRKRLGQNFLRDTLYLSRIVQAAELEPGDAVLEVGAGTGVLTRELARRAGRLVAVELDDALVEVLRAEYANDRAVTIWHGNALDLDPSAIFPGRYKLVGNIPYYITGPLLRHFLEARHRPALLVLMVQREVAERMAAGPGDMSLLAVSVQMYADVAVVTRVPAGAFYPPPKVESAVVRLRPRVFPGSQGLEQTILDLARAGFGMRRKQLKTALSAGLDQSRETVIRLLTAADIAPTRRAESLTLGDWVHLARVWTQWKEGGARSADLETPES